MAELQNQNIPRLYPDLDSNKNYIRQWVKEVISSSSEYNSVSINKYI